MPKVSVIIPCYNHGMTLERAVDSVLQQTLGDLEILVVDDGSTSPETLRILESFSMPKTRLIHSTNRGVAAARNLGIKLAEGEYVLPLDADDYIGKEYLEKAVAVLESRTDVGLVYGEAQLFGAVEGHWELPAFSYPHMLLDNMIYATALFRRRDWKRCGGYNERFQAGWEDWDFWLRLLADGVNAVRLPETCFFYCIQDGSRDASIGRLRKLALMIRILRDHWDTYLKNCPTLISIILRGQRRRSFYRGAFDE